MSEPTDARTVKGSRMIRRSGSDTRADMLGTDWGKKLGGKERWRKGKLALLLCLTR